MITNEEHLHALEKDLKRYLPMFRDATTAIIEQDVSNYPIFVAHRDYSLVGISLLDRHKSNTFWSFSASTLEEFVSKQIVDSSKVEDFKTIYKNPKAFICVFVLDEQDSQFVFYKAIGT
jgi:hypothetical protein